MTDSNKEIVLGECKNNVLEVLKRSVRPEFLNRIDEVIMFEPLSKKDVYGILKLQINQIKELLAEKGVTLTFTDDAIEYLANKGYDIAYGARPIKRLLQKELINALATKIISGEIAKDHTVNVTVKDNNLVFAN
jgi:ATP-dependent Clp protease ATP-binding subunit ClpB